MTSTPRKIRDRSNLELSQVSNENQKRISKILNSIKDSWNEETLKINFVFPFCRITNWKVDSDDNGDLDTKIETERYQPKRGRLDLLLLDKGIPRIVIECKKPSVTLVKKGTITTAGVEAMKQVHRYAQGVRFWRKGCLPNILSVVINGKEVIWFDSSCQSFDDCMKTAKSELITLDVMCELFQVIHVDAVRSHDMAHACQTRTIFDEREAIKFSSTHHFSLKVLSWLKEIQKCKKISKTDSLAMTLQVLFLTVARDHGILGSEEIQIKVDDNNWDELFKVCKRRFNSNVFETPRPGGLSTSVLNKVYQDSKNLPYSLEAIPVEYVGDIYETLLHNLHRDNPTLSKTSYYTPEWLVKEIIHDLKPDLTDTILDPTCGSAAFLTYAFDYVAKDLDFTQARDFLEKSIYGVDRDDLAVQVSRFALLVSLARKVDGDWIEKEHILPNLTNHIVPSNFLTFSTDKKFTIAVGNPPWGSIDHEIKDNAIKDSLKTYKSYKDKTDICTYILERAFNMLSSKGKFGFLVQRSSIDGVQHSNFQKWLNGRAEKIWDFERDELFAPRNKALTAVLIGKVGSSLKKPKITNRSAHKISKSKLKINGASFGDLFHVFQGAQAAKNEVYDLYALEKPEDENCRYVISPESIKNGIIEKNEVSYFLHPDTLDSELDPDFINWLNDTKIAGKKRGKKTVIKKSCMWWLKNRAEVIRSSRRKDKSLSWLWLNGKEHYTFDKKQNRIVFSYYLNGDRLSAGIDLEGEMVPLTSTTVLIPKTDTSRKDVIYALAWLNSKSFVATEAMKGKLSASGGRALYKDYVEGMLIPEIGKELKHAIVDYITPLLINGLSDHDLIILDKMFAEAIEISNRAQVAIEKIHLLNRKKSVKKVKKVA